ncbi:MAG: helix-turn-helix transcriptional regulator [Pseudomonadota bacterium]
MLNSARLVATLKRELRARALTYRDLAGLLDLSESAVKHMFSTANFSLRRLDSVCDALGLDIGELVALSEAHAPRLERLPAEFEDEIVGDIRFLLITYCLVNHWTFDEIVARYRIERAEGFRYLRRLDQMKIIEVLPGDRVRLLIASNFAWRKNGAMERFFNQRVQTDFFKHDFTADGSLRIAKNGMLSKKAQHQLADKLRAIGELFDDTSFEERKLSADDKHGTTMVLALRQWIFEGFRELERPEAARR